MSSLAHQTLVEHQIIAHVKDALRLTLETKTATVSMPRKLSIVRFMCDSFERHLERLLDLEEDGGYMSLVRERKPQLYEEVVALRAEHGRFRDEVKQIQQSLHALGDADEERFGGQCHRLHDLLERLEEHDAKEIGILEQVLLGDESAAST